MAPPARLVPGLALALGAAGAVLGLRLLWARRQREERRRARGNGVPRVPVPVEVGSGAVSVPLLQPEEQVDLLERLDFVLRNIAELRKEVEELRSSLQRLAAEIVSEVRSHLEETQRVTRRRRFPFPRERSDSTGSSSIYFTASSGAANTDDGESEGGYTTANAESDYDRESERESEEGEDEVSCETVRTARRDSLDLVNEEETHLLLDSSLEEGLGQLLQQADRLHDGDEQEKREGFQLLLNNKLAYADQKDFVWRLARAHSDMCEIAEDTEEKRSYAYDGKEELEVALQKWDQSAECHQCCDARQDKQKSGFIQSLVFPAAERSVGTLSSRDLETVKGDKRCVWVGSPGHGAGDWRPCGAAGWRYAVLCGQLSEHESIQKRIQTGYVFKEHIDKAIELKPEDPKSHYLLGRWCYQVSHLGWLEKKAASALFEAPPTATVQDALQNFLRVEELSPGFSKAGRVYIAKCYKDLGNNSAATLWMNLASELPAHTKEDEESERELEEMQSAWEE